MPKPKKGVTPKALKPYLFKKGHGKPKPKKNARKRERRD
jgi:hypothetical protein